MSLTIVHASDVHIGSSMTTRFAWHAGFSGHEQRALDAFLDALDVLVARPGDKLFVMSGDASARGSEAQLTNYRTLVDVGYVRDVVTRRPAWRDGFDAGVLEIPGNHDYWPRMLAPTLRHASRATYFPPPPWRVTVTVGRHLVALHGLCSTAGTSGEDQVYAVGRVAEDDLAALVVSIKTAAAAAGKKPVTHAVVTHHSPSSGSTDFMGLADAAGLLEFLQAHHVRAILTGHTHDHRVVDGSPAEIRCSTTLQRNVWYQNGWWPARQQRQFWVHELVDDAGALRWTATPWVFDDNRVFREADEDRVTIT